MRRELAARGPRFRGTFSTRNAKQRRAPFLAVAFVALMLAAAVPPADALSVGTLSNVTQLPDGITTQAVLFRDLEGVARTIDSAETLVNNATTVWLRLTEDNPSAYRVAFQKPFLATTKGFALPKFEVRAPTQDVAWTTVVPRETSTAFEVMLDASWTGRTDVLEVRVTESAVPWSLAALESGGTVFGLGSSSSILLDRPVGLWWSMPTWTTWSETSVTVDNVTTNTTEPGRLVLDFQPAVGKNNTGAPVLFNKQWLNDTFRLNASLGFEPLFEWGHGEKPWKPLHVTETATHYVVTPESFSTIGVTAASNGTVDVLLNSTVDEYNWSFLDDVGEVHAISPEDNGEGWVGSPDAYSLGCAAGCNGDTIETISDSLYVRQRIQVDPGTVDSVRWACDCEQAIDTFIYDSPSEGVMGALLAKSDFPAESQGSDQSILYSPYMGSNLTFTTTQHVYVVAQVNGTLNTFSVNPEWSVDSGNSNACQHSSTIGGTWTNFSPAYSCVVGIYAARTNVFTRHAGEAHGSKGGYVPPTKVVGTLFSHTGGSTNVDESTYVAAAWTQPKTSVFQYAGVRLRCASGGSAPTISPTLYRVGADGVTFGEALSMTNPNRRVTTFPSSSTFDTWLLMTFNPVVLDAGSNYAIRWMSTEPDCSLEAMSNQTGSMWFINSTGQKDNTIEPSVIIADGQWASYATLHIPNDGRHDLTPYSDFSFIHDARVNATITNTNGATVRINSGKAGGPAATNLNVTTTITGTRNTRTGPYGTVEYLAGLDVVWYPNHATTPSIFDTKNSTIHVRGVHVEWNASTRSIGSNSERERWNFTPAISYANATLETYVSTKAKAVANVKVFGEATDRLESGARTWSLSQAYFNTASARVEVPLPPMSKQLVMMGNGTFANYISGCCPNGERNFTGIPVGSRLVEICAMGDSEVGGNGNPVNVDFVDVKGTGFWRCGKAAPNTMLNNGYLRVTCTECAYDYLPHGGTAGGSGNGLHRYAIKIWYEPPGATTVQGDVNMTHGTDFDITVPGRVRSGDYIIAQGLIRNVNGVPISGFETYMNVTTLNGEVALGGTGPEYNITNGNFLGIMTSTYLAPAKYKLVISFRDTSNNIIAKKAWPLTVGPGDADDDCSGESCLPVYTDSVLYYKFFDNRTGAGLDEDFYKFYVSGDTTIDESDRVRDGRMPILTGRSYYVAVKDYFGHTIFPTNNYYCVGRDGEACPITSTTSTYAVLPVDRSEVYIDIGITTYQVKMKNTQIDPAYVEMTANGKTFQTYVLPGEVTELRVPYDTYQTTVTMYDANDPSMPVDYAYNNTLLGNAGPYWMPTTRWGQTGQPTDPTFCLDLDTSVSACSVSAPQSETPTYVGTLDLNRVVTSNRLDFKFYDGDARIFGGYKVEVNDDPDHNPWRVVWDSTLNGGLGGAADATNGFTTTRTGASTVSGSDRDYQGLQSHTMNVGVSFRYVRFFATGSDASAQARISDVSVGSSATANLVADKDTFLWIRGYDIYSVVFAINNLNSLIFDQQVNIGVHINNQDTTILNQTLAVAAMFNNTNSFVGQQLVGMFAALNNTNSTVGNQFVYQNALINNTQTTLQNQFVYQNALFNNTNVSLQNQFVYQNALFNNSFTNITEQGVYQNLLINNTNSSITTQVASVSLNLTNLNSTVLNQFAATQLAIANLNTNVSNQFTAVSTYINNTNASIQTQINLLEAEVLNNGVVPPVDTRTLAYYAFDESGGTSLNDTGQRGLHGTLANANATPPWGEGRFGSAYAFDGSNDEFVVPHHADLNLNENFSLSFWVKPTVDAPSGTFPGILRKGEAGTNAAGWLVYLDGSTESPVFKRDNTGKSAAAPATVGVWNHYVFSYNNVSKAWAWFKDGVQTASGTQTYVFGTASNALQVGKGDSVSLNGALDDVYLLSRTLNATEAQAYKENVNPQVFLQLNLLSQSVTNSNVTIQNQLNVLRSTVASTESNITNQTNAILAQAVTQNSNLSGQFNFISAAINNTNVTVLNQINALSANVTNFNVSMQNQLNSIHSEIVNNGLTTALVGGTVGAWSFDELGASVNDSSPFENNGTYVGVNASRPAPGKLGAGLEFDGNDSVVYLAATNGAANYVTGGVRPIDWMLNGSKAVTAFVYPHRVKGDGQAIVATRNLGTAGGAGWGFALDGSNHLLFEGADGVSSASVTGTTVLPVGEWSHVAVTYDNATRFVQFFVNGVEAGNGTLAVTPSPGGQFFLGGEDWRSSGGALDINNDHEWGFDGYLDEVRVVARNLTGEEIAALSKGINLAVLAQFNALSQSVSNANVSLASQVNFVTTQIVNQNTNLTTQFNQLQTNIDQRSSNLTTQVNALAVNITNSNSTIMAQVNYLAIAVNNSNASIGKQVNDVWATVNNTNATVVQQANNMLLAISNLNANVTNQTNFLNLTIRNTETNISTQVNSMWASVVNNGVRPATDESTQGYWAFDEGKGTQTNDSSVRNQVGTLVNTPADPWVTGKFGNALAFDGVDDSVTAGNMTMGGAYTLAAWVNPTATPTRSMRIVNGLTGTFGLRVDAGGALRFAWNDGASTSDGITGGVAYGGVWTHVAATHDGTTARLYVNGSLVASKVAPTIARGAETLAIGNDTRVADGTAAFAGVVDEVYAYARDLSATEVQGLYAGVNSAMLVQFNAIQAQVVNSNTNISTQFNLLNVTIRNSEGNITNQTTLLQAQLLNVESNVTNQTNGIVLNIANLNTSMANQFNGVLVNISNSNLSLQNQTNLILSTVRNEFSVMNEPVEPQFLVARYLMDEQSGFVLVDDGPSARNATLEPWTNNTVPLRTVGYQGGGIGFDRHLHTVTLPTAVVTTNTSGQHTVAAWGYLTGVDGAGASLVSTRNSGNGSGEPGWRVGVDASRRPTFEVGYSAGVNGTFMFTASNGTAVPLNAWTHYVFTWNDSAPRSTIRIWVNGVEQTLTTNTIPGDQGVPVGSHARMGGEDAHNPDNNGGHDAGWEGVLDKVAFYSRSVTTPEARALYWGTGVGVAEQVNFLSQSVSNNNASISAQVNVFQTQVTNNFSKLDLQYSAIHSTVNNTNTSIGNQLTTVSAAISSTNSTMVNQTNTILANIASENSTMVNQTNTILTSIVNANLSLQNQTNLILTRILNDFAVDRGTDRAYLYLPFDDENATRVAKDYSKFGRDAQLNGFTAVTPDGRVGGAMQARGPNGAGAHYAAHDAGYLRLNGSVSVAAWVYADDWNNVGQSGSDQHTWYIFSNDRDCACGPQPEHWGGASLRVEGTGHNLLGRVTVGTPGAGGSAVTRGITSNTALQTGAWYHVAYTYDGRVSKLFINGSLDRSVDHGSVAALLQQNESAAWPDKYAVGAMAGSQGFAPWHGRIDEVKVWNESLTEDEVKADAFMISPAILNQVNLLSQSISNSNVSMQAQFNVLNGQVINLGSNITNQTNFVSTLINNTQALINNQFNLVNVTIRNSETNISTQLNGLSQTVNNTNVTLASQLNLLKSEVLNNGILPPVDNSTVAAWTFEDARGTTSAADDSPFGNHGTYGPAASLVPGRFGQAVALNGVSGQVNVSDADSLSFADNVFTVAAWVNLSSGTGDQGILGKRGSGCWEYSLWRSAGAAANTLRFETWNTGGSGVYTGGYVTVTPGVWTHLAFVANGTHMTTYVDGVEWNTVAKSALSMGNGNCPLTIGSAGPTAGPYTTTAQVDEVRLYKRALAAREVRAVAENMHPVVFEQFNLLEAQVTNAEGNLTTQVNAVNVTVANANATIGAQLNYANLNVNNTNAQIQSQVNGVWQTVNNTNASVLQQANLILASIVNQNSNISEQFNTVTLKVENSETNLSGQVNGVWLSVNNTGTHITNQTSIITAQLSQVNSSIQNQLTVQLLAISNSESNITNQTILIQQHISNVETNLTTQTTTIQASVSSANSTIVNQTNAILAAIVSDNLTMVNQTNAIIAQILSANLNATNQTNVIAASIASTESNITNQTNFVAGQIVTQNANLTTQFNVVNSAIFSTESNITNQTNVLAASIVSTNATMVNQTNAIQASIVSTNVNLTTQYNSIVGLIQTSNATVVEQTNAIIAQMISQNVNISEQTNLITASITTVNGTVTNQTNFIAGQIVTQNTNLSNQFNTLVTEVVNNGLRAAADPTTLAHWEFDDGVGNSFANDSSPNKRNATLTSMETSDWTAGRFGGALDFDGSTSERASGTVTMAGNITACGWFYPDQVRAQGLLADTGSGAAWRIFSTSAGAVEAEATNTGTYGVADVWNVQSAPASLPVGVWTHVCLTYDNGTSPLATLYVNGQPVATSTDKFNNSGGATLEVAPLVTNRFDGRVDDVRLYNRALSGGDVASVYANLNPTVLNQFNTIAAGISTTNATVVNQTNVIGGQISNLNSTVVTQFNALVSSIANTNSNISEQTNVLSAQISVVNGTVTNQTNFLAQQVVNQNTNISTQFNALASTVHNAESNITNQTNLISVAIQNMNATIGDQFNFVNVRINTTNASLANQINALSATVENNNLTVLQQVNLLWSSVNNTNASIGTSFVLLNQKADFNQATINNSFVQVRADVSFANATILNNITSLNASVQARLLELLDDVASSSSDSFNQTADILNNLATRTERLNLSLLENFTALVDQVDDRTGALLAKELELLANLSAAHASINQNVTVRTVEVLAQVNNRSDDLVNRTVAVLANLSATNASLTSEVLARSLDVIANVTVRSDDLANRTLTILANLSNVNQSLALSIANTTNAVLLQVNNRSDDLVTRQLAILENISASNSNVTSAVQASLTQTLAHMTNRSDDLVNRTLVILANLSNVNQSLNQELVARTLAVIAQVNNRSDELLAREIELLANLSQTNTTVTNQAIAILGNVSALTENLAVRTLSIIENVTYSNLTAVNAVAAAQLAVIDQIALRHAEATNASLGLLENLTGVNASLANAILQTALEVEAREAANISRVLQNASFTVQALGQIPGATVADYVQALMRNMTDEEAGIFRRYIELQVVQPIQNIGTNLTTSTGSILDRLNELNDTAIQNLSARLGDVYTALLQPHTIYVPSLNYSTAPDEEKPFTRLRASPVLGNASDVRVSWQATDNVVVQSVRVYYRRDNESWSILTADAHASGETKMPNAIVGATYSFKAIATDGAGNVEVDPADNASRSNFVTYVHTFEAFPYDDPTLSETVDGGTVKLVPGAGLAWLLVLLAAAALAFGRRRA